MSQEISDRWILFACATLGRNGEHSVQRAAKLADEMLNEYEIRFGNDALLIQGIRMCAICEKDFSGGEVFRLMRSEDGTFMKFCQGCVAENEKEVKVSDEL